ncbi:hypothetical protein KIN20_019584 [Parelaphostrongylus tenuis]|uniref:Uncharacterized protein n=1 Tax=Parelaphostrongylus tenuis TaxID=148309 RepID=A0AAD5ML79_PARTN|nr:hypothetical protein KIN20_019584 [Parelaphostrongylus tenuis]
MSRASAAYLPRQYFSDPAQDDQKNGFVDRGQLKSWTIVAAVVEVILSVQEHDFTRVGMIRNFKLGS